MLVNGIDTPYYHVTTTGEVFNIEGKKLTKHLTHDGYYRVKLSRGIKRGMYRVNRLVAENYLENPLGYPIVNHLDNDRTNNHVENLEWCNNSNNQKQRFKNKLGTKAKQVEQRSLSGDLITTYDSPLYAEIATGVARQNIAKVARGERNQAGGFKWNYL